MKQVRLAGLIFALSCFAVVRGVIADQGAPNAGPNSSALMQPTYNNSGIGAPSGQGTSGRGKRVKEKAVEVDPRTLRTDKKDERFERNLFGGDVKSIQEVKPVSNKAVAADGNQAEHKAQEKVSAGVNENGAAQPEKANTKKSENPSPTASPTASASPAPEAKR